MPGGLVWIEVGGKEGLGAAPEAGVASIDEVFVAVHRRRL